MAKDSRRDARAKYLRDRGARLRHAGRHTARGLLAGNPGGASARRRADTHSINARHCQAPRTQAPTQTGPGQETPDRQDAGPEIEEEKGMQRNGLLPMNSGGGETLCTTG